MPRLPIYTVDAFTLGQQHFTGNPAAVCLIPAHQGLDDPTLQRIAAEMNLSETAYVQPILPSDWPTADRSNGGDPTAFQELTDFHLRWFTPDIEVPLCGHATLASAHVLMRELGNTAPAIQFHTKSGILRVTKESIPEGDCLNMMLPLNPAFPLGTNPAEAPAQLMTKKRAEGEEAQLPVFSSEWTSKTQQIVDSLFDPENGTPNVVAVGFSPTIQYLMIHIEGGPSVLRKLKPVFTPSLLALGHECSYTGIIVVTTGDGGDLDGAARFFAPWVGVNEDPVTGSAYTVVAPYWQKLTKKPTATFIQGGNRQGKARTFLCPEFEGYVQVSGSGVTFLSGTFHY
ncbi:hypothetical protein BJ085DRAFT_35181 [Dimargaris cristalligena]|uniref:Uncharacterized protein n=1 Tax=Dimargaris cristalligena TaxID=215637 RepID=A0A4Q0A327_9FUNG|nr:hypothetical protein BJ085DRAFT_35181 [Dimargaris cristalligena]|eukprot:RKP39951.1 hypothetical protein BJ085DRAFT_35181 [Dimargaris cristalligena]